MKTPKTTENAPSNPAGTGGWRDAIVMAGGAAFALAAAMGLYAQHAVPPLYAGVIGLVLFVTLAAIQVALRRSDEVATLKVRLTRLEAQLASAEPHSEGVPAAASYPDAIPAEIEHEFLETEERIPSPMATAGTHAPEQIDSRSSFGSAPPARSVRQRVVSGWGTPRNATPAPVQSGSPEPAPMQRGHLAAAQKVVPQSYMETPPPLPPELSGGSTQQRGADTRYASLEGQSYVPAPPALPHEQRMQTPPMARAQATPVGAMIGQIASELGAYRPGEERAEPTPSAMEMVAAAPQSLTARVLDAVEAGRVEIFLQPIVGLEDRTVACYEAFTRLKDANGVLMLPSEYSAPARSQGVIAEIEKIAAFRTINLLERLEERKKLAPIFLNISRQTLVDGNFFREIGAVIKEYRQLASGLVFEFTQHEARSFNEEELENLDSLTRMGFSFGIDEITDLEMDFVPLIERQFAFAKLRAVQFLEGLPSSGTDVPTAEIGPMFEEAGLQLIIEGIEDEGMLAHVETHGMKFGQGPVFAEPSPVKAEFLSGQTVAA